MVLCVILFYVQNKTKLDSRAEKGVFVGYDRSSPTFLVYYPDQNNVKKIRCVKFAEKFDSVDENVNLLPDSVEATEPEMPKPENGQESIRRYPTRDCAKPKYLVDYHKIPKISPSKYKPPKPVTQKNLR